MTRESNQFNISFVSHTEAVLRSSNSDLQSRLSTALSELHELRRQQDQKLVASSEEKAAMQDAAQRLNAEIAHARKELKMALEKGQIVEKTKAELQLVNQSIDLLTLN